MDQNLLLGQMMGLLMKRIVVPSDFSGQCVAIKTMLADDVCGLVDTLTDFLVESSSVDFSIETQNEKLNELFQDWMDSVNIDYGGTVPMGMTELAKEYMKERWKGSSFPVLKIAKWTKVSGTDFIFPTQLYFVDGSSIKAIDKENTAALTLNSYNYFIGEPKTPGAKLEKDVIFARPFGRWFDKYPTPYLIKRGVYHNWKIIESLKNKETEILDQIIPYLLLIKKGSAELFKDSQKSYSNEDLAKVIEDFQGLLSDYRNTAAGDKQVKSPARAVNFDETIEQLIPDLKTIFNPQLFEQAERNILGGLGFVDIVQGVSSERREAILNPKPFMQETESGVAGFKGIIKQLVLLIKEKNDSHIKYNSNTLYVCNSPIKSFQTDKFRDTVRQLYDRGLVSKRTTVELMGNVDFNTETFRREQETTSGLDYTMYPPIITNMEDKGIDTQGKNPNPSTPEKITKDNIPEDKKGIEKKQYKASEVTEAGKVDLVTAPYTKLTDLPPAVKEKLSVNQQRAWMRIWNTAYHYMLNKTGNAKTAETYAFRVAWSQVKKVNKSSTGFLASIKELFHLTPSEEIEFDDIENAEIERECLEEATTNEHKLEEARVLKEKSEEILDKQKKLLDKLLGDNNETI